MSIEEVDIVAYESERKSLPYTVECHKAGAVNRWEIIQGGTMLGFSFREDHAMELLAALNGNLNKESMKDEMTQYLDEFEENQEAWREANIKEVQKMMNPYIGKGLSPWLFYLLSVINMGTFAGILYMLLERI